MDSLAFRFARDKRDIAIRWRRVVGGREATRNSDRWRTGLEFVSQASTKQNDKARSGDCDASRQTVLKHR